MWSHTSSRKRSGDHSGQFCIMQSFLNLFQNNATSNNTPLHPLNGDSPSAVDGNPGSRKRPSDTPTENSRKKIKTGEENSNQACIIVCVGVGI